MEISSSDFRILKSTNFADQNILVKNCSYLEEKQCIYFFSYAFPVLPEVLILNLFLPGLLSCKIKNSGNTFYKCPQETGDCVAAIDGQNSLFFLRMAGFKSKRMIGIFPFYTDYLIFSL